MTAAPTSVWLTVSALACNKSVPDALIAKLQARLDRLIADGTQQRIFDRYNLVSP